MPPRTARSTRPQWLWASDGRAWRSVFGALAERFDDITADFLRPMLHVPEHPVKLARFGLYSALPAAVLARRWSTDEARALFAGVAAHAFRPVRLADVLGDRRRARHRGAPLWMAGRRGRVGLDQRGDDLAARAGRRAVRDRRPGAVARRARRGGHRHARPRTRGRGPDRRRPDAAPDRPGAHALPARPGDLQGRLRRARAESRGPTSPPGAPARCTSAAA